MTVVSQIIIDAFRQSNLLALGVAPTTPQSDEALRYLNRIVKSVFGNEVGDQLDAFPIGRNDISRPQGWPWYNQTPPADWFVPKNTRVMLNLEASVSLYLHPLPDDGSRFAVSDPSENVATFNVTIYGNGRTIEGQPSIVLNTNSIAAEWYYRQDLADWVRYSPLEADDTFPFPEEFDDFFITMLAMRLNPSYGTMIDTQSQEALRRARSQIRARYQSHREQPSEGGLVRLPRTAADRDPWNFGYGYYNPDAAFNRGFPW